MNTKINPSNTYFKSFINGLVVLMLVFAALANVVSPAAAQAVTPKDLGNIVVDGSSNPWPTVNPFPAAKAAEVVKCQPAPGTYDADGVSHFFDLTSTEGYKAMTAFCLTGVVWFKDMAPDGAKFENTAAAVPVPAAPVSSPATCSTLPTRDERLNCATKAYFNSANSGGTKLDSTKAMLTSMGITWSELKISDPFQPDAKVTADGPQLWGALVLAKDLKVTGNSCIVTDVPSRIKTSGWSFVDSRYTQPVTHAGNAETVNAMVEVAIHLDCTDWPEIVSAMTADPTKVDPAKADPTKVDPANTPEKNAEALSIIDELIALLKKLALTLSK